MKLHVKVIYWEVFLENWLWRGVGEVKGDQLAQFDQKISMMQNFSAETGTVPSKPGYVVSPVERGKEGDQSKCAVNKIPQKVTLV